MTNTEYLIYNQYFISAEHVEEFFQMLIKDAEMNQSINKHFRPMNLLYDDKNMVVKFSSQL